MSHELTDLLDIVDRLDAVMAQPFVKRAMQLVDENACTMEEDGECECPRCRQWVKDKVADEGAEQFMEERHAHD